MPATSSQQRQAAVNIDVSPKIIKVIETSGDATFLYLKVIPLYKYVSTLLFEFDRKLHGT